MKIPLFEAAEETKVLITPEQQVANLIQNMDLGLKPLPKKCIFSAMNPKRIEKFLAGWKLTQEIKSGDNPGSYPYKIFTKGKEEFVLVYAGGMGPSAMSNTLEIIIAMGVEEVYLIGLGGGMQELGVGEIVIGTEAIRDEGVSYHYLDKSKPAKASKELVEAIKNKIPEAHLGKIWTTDCMYRETHSKFLKYSKEGALVVDMESASAYAIAEFRKIKLVSCLVISDKLNLKNWEPSFDSELIDKGIKNVLDKVLA